MEEIELDRKSNLKIWIDLILIILIIVFIVAIIWLIIIFKFDAYRCLEDPKLYYEDMKNLSCECRESFSIRDLTNINSIRIGNTSLNTT